MSCGFWAGVLVLVTLRDVLFPLSPRHFLTTEPCLNLSLLADTFSLLRLFPPRIGFLSLNSIFLSIPPEPLSSGSGAVSDTAFSDVLQFGPFKGTLESLSLCPGVCSENGFI